MRYNTNNLLSKVGLYIFVGLVAYMPLHTFLSTWVGSGLGILSGAKVAKDIILLVGVALTLAATRRIDIVGLPKNRTTQLILGYGALTVVLALLRSNDTDAEVLAVVYNTRFLVMFIYAQLLCMLFDPMIIINKVIRVVLGVAALVTLIGLVQYLILPPDAFSHFGYSESSGVLPSFSIDNNPGLERIMSTVRDPNSYGSYLVLIICLCIWQLKSKVSKPMKRGIVVLTLLATVNLLATFSRSAWVGLVLSLCILAGLYKQSLAAWASRYRVQLAAVIVLLIAAAGVAPSTSLGQNILFHTSDKSTSRMSANQKRAGYWQQSLQTIINDPWGAGPGSAGPTSVHNTISGPHINENYYLQIIQEVGVLGFGFFVSIVSIVAWRLAHSRASIAKPLLGALVALLFTGLFVHTWANETLAYLWWGLAGLALATAHKKSPQTT